MPVITISYEAILTPREQLLLLANVVSLDKRRE